MMLRRLMLTLAAPVVMAGCAQDAPAQPPQPFAVPTTTAAPTPSSAQQTPAKAEMFGPRVELPGGLLQKQLGKVAEYGGPDDDDSNTWGVRVVLDSIELDPKCDPYMEKPPRGHRLLLTMRVETSPDYDPSQDGSGPDYNAWSTVSRDGISEAPMSSNQACRSSTNMPLQLRAAAKCRGTVNVDTANSSGQLVLNNGLVWNFPT